MFMKEKILKVKSHSSETHTQAGNTLYNSVSKIFLCKSVQRRRFMFILSGQFKTNHIL